MLRRFIISAGHAALGIIHAFKHERHFRFHCFAVVPVVAAGVYVGLSPVAWGLVVITMGFVLAAELVNTALERLGDLAAHGERNALSGLAKDIAAGAVLVAAVAAAVVGVVVVLVPLIRKVFGIN